MPTYSKFTKDQRIESLSQRILQYEAEMHNMETTVAILDELPAELSDEGGSEAVEQAKRAIKTFEHSIKVCHAEIAKLKASAKRK